MTNLSERLLHYANILMVNNFDTEKGRYTLRVMEYHGEFYVHKMKNGEVVEIKNLNKEARKGKIKCLTKM